MLWIALLTSNVHAREMVWAGVDLSMVRLVGVEALPATEARRKKPGLPAETWAPDFVQQAARDWNDEIEPYALTVTDDRFRVRPQAQTGHLYNVHSQLAELPVVDDDRDSGKPFLTRADVLVRVATYPRNPIGMSFTLIADQLNTHDRRGCFWATFFDAGTGVVHETEYRCGATGTFGRDAVKIWYGTAKRTIGDLPERKLPDARVRIHLTEAEIDEVSSRFPNARAVLAEAAEAAEKMAEEAVEDHERRKQQRDMLWSTGGAEYVTVRTTQEGLALLREHGMAFQPVASPAPMGEQADCKTAYGKTACGYDCTVAFGDVKCAGSPGGRCKVAFGEITCSN